MYVVAVTRQAGGAPDMAELAQLAGVSPYDMRLRLAGALPVVFSHSETAEQARAHMRRLRELGFGAVGCDMAQVPTGEAIVSARSFELRPDSVVVEASDGTRLELPADRVLALVHAMVAADSRTLETSTQKKLSLARTVATGGLVRNKAVERQSHGHASEHEPTLYLVQTDGRQCVAFRQEALRYDGLGRPLPLTRPACFQRLVQRLREVAPHALYDDRLLKQKRKPSGLLQARERSATRGSPQQTQSVTATNQGATELAAYLIAIAHWSGQLEPPA